MILQPINLTLEIIAPNRPGVLMIVSYAMVEQSQHWHFS